MADVFNAIIDGRPTDAISRAQISLILGLDPVLQAAGLILTCARCAADGTPVLVTANSPEDTIWKIDCACRRRRVTRAGSQPMEPSGDLLLMAADLLRPLGLELRCPARPCLLQPLDIRQTAAGVRVTCHCGTKRHFHKTPSVRRPH
jgi:hypothetical protein